MPPADMNIHERDNHPTLFTGIEQEGVRFKGLRTLFVKGDVPVAEIQKHVSIANHIYFGAGGLSAYNLDTVKWVLANLRKPVTIETEEVVPIDFITHESLFVVATFLIFGKRTKLDRKDFWRMKANASGVVAKFCTGKEIFFVDDIQAFVPFDGYPDDKVLWRQE